VILLVARRQAKREGTMLRVLVVCYVIGFVSCQIRLNSTISDDEINGTIVRVNEVVTKSDIAVSKVDEINGTTVGVNEVVTKSDIAVSKVDEINGTIVRVNEVVTKSDIAVSKVDEINGTIVRVNEVVTKSDIAISKVELATASTQNVSSNPISTEDFMLNDRQCPSNSSKPCVVKCCPLGESIAISKVCEPSTLKFQVIFFGENGESNATAADNGDYDYIFGDPCLYER